MNDHLSTLDFFRLRLRIGVLVLLGVLSLAAVAHTERLMENVIYPMSFSLSFLATGFLLGFQDRGRQAARSSVEPAAAHRILLVEERAGLWAQLAQNLASRGFEVQTASSGEVQTAPPSTRPAFDVVILDAQLPYVTLVTIKSSLRKQRPEQPLIILDTETQDIGLRTSPRFRIVEALGSRRVHRDVRAALRSLAA